MFAAKETKQVIWLKLYLHQRWSETHTNIAREVFLETNTEGL